MKTIRWAAYVLIVLLPLLVGAARMLSHLERTPSPLTATSQAPAPPPPTHDPRRKTVAVVLAADISEITDVLGPYEMFARAGMFNVYAVAPRKGSTALTGGLRMRPHHTFDELDRLLEGAPPDIVVAPNLPNIRSPENRSVVDWVRRSADRGATSLSWCAGAAVLAEAGLLDGLSATTHWGDLSRLERDYPRVTWLRETRWIDHGRIITSAGITSGIDATLRLLMRTEGADVARRVAAELRYPNYHFAMDPHAEQYVPRVSDAVLFLNAAFRPTRSRIGMALYDGIGELDLSAVYDAHAATGTANVLALAAAPGLVLTRHGLALEPALVPHRDRATLGSLDRFIVPGRDARSRAGAVVASIEQVVDREPEYLQADGGERFSLEPILEDLARTTDRLTAAFAVRRLEYRSDGIRLAGGSTPRAALLTMVLSLGAALLLALALAHGTRPRIERRVPAPVRGRPCSRAPFGPKGEVDELSRRRAASGADP